MTQAVTKATPAITALAAHDRQSRLLALLMSFFFAFGFCTVLVDTLVPKFKAMFSLSYTEVMLTQFCYFGAYFVFSLPAGWLISRIGYLRSVAVGLVVMAVGAFGFAPAAIFGTYPGFLAALFILAAGVTVVQVAVNPVTALAGPAEKSSARLTLAQAFNSLATTVGPLFGAWAILSHVQTPPENATPQALEAFRLSEAHVFVAPFVSIAVLLLLLALLCWFVRGWSPPAATQNLTSLLRLMQQPRVMLGALCIFTYVGAEVSIGSSMTNYLLQTHSWLGRSAAYAGSLVSVYWGLAMVGRFGGSAVLSRVRPALVLCCCAIGAGALVLFSSFSAGAVAGISLLAVGLFNSIMFPTIFTLAIEGLGEDTPEASGLICLAIVGGAVVPLLFGATADHFGLSRALLVPVICYGYILFYGALIWRGFVSAPVLTPVEV